MPRVRLAILTSLAMLAFAGNSLLCRMALARTDIDAATFTTVRIVSGALALWLLVRVSRGGIPGRGNSLSALALLVYAAAFSFAYVNLTAATGALLLFAAVQATMIGYGLWIGERLRLLQSAGVVLALAGLVGLLLPGLAAPPPDASFLMLAAGVAWGIYSLRGRGAGDPVRVTAGNFARAVPLALVLSVFLIGRAVPDPSGIALASASGALASAVGYAIWYTTLPSLRAATAATVQLSVPLITAAGGVLLLGEALTVRLLMAAVAILGGIWLVTLRVEPASASTSSSGRASARAGRRDSSYDRDR